MRCFLKRRVGREKRRVASSEWRVGSEPGAQATGFGSHPTPSTRHLAPVFRALALAALTVPCSLFPVPSLAQSPTYKLGRTPTAEELRAWDTAVGPEGKELPAGSGTAKQGAKVYTEKCASCHGADGAGIQARPLIGGHGTLKTDRPVRTVGSYWAYATTIWDYINRSMPWKEEGTLTPDEVYAVTAFLLHRNGIISETDVLDAKSLPKVQMPNRDGFIPARPEWKPQEKRPFGIYP